MKKKQQQDSQNQNIYNHTQHIFRAHEPLLTDRVRNRAFLAALKLHVKPGSAVLDIGSGTGIWAITAALLGASRVVAVEKDSLLIPIIRNLIRENGVGDKVELIQGHSSEIALDERFDLIVSETIGNQAFEEEIVSIMVDAKKRFLKPGGVLIPSQVSLIVAPAYLKNSLKASPAGVPIKCGYFESLNLNAPLMLLDKSRLKIESSPKELFRADLNREGATLDLSNLTARWKNADIARVNCFAVWAEMVLAKGVRLSTLDTSSWSPVIYAIRPFKQSSGTLELTFNLTEKTHYWTASLSNRKEKEIQSYSPVFAYTSLMTHMNMADAFAKR
jgi:precorrin-6B methylase 2